MLARLAMKRPPDRSASTLSLLMLGTSQSAARSIDVERASPGRRRRWRRSCPDRCRGVELRHGIGVGAARPRPPADCRWAQSDAADVVHDGGVGAAGRGKDAQVVAIQVELLDHVADLVGDQDAVAAGAEDGVVGVRDIVGRVRSRRRSRCRSIGSSAMIRSLVESGTSSRPVASRARLARVRAAGSGAASAVGAVLSTPSTSSACDGLRSRCAQRRRAGRPAATTGASTISQVRSLPPVLLMVSVCCVWRFGCWLLLIDNGSTKMLGGRTVTVAVAVAVTTSMGPGCRQSTRPC